MKRETLQTNNNLLPKDIDYSIYHSLQGMATSKWGPNCWDFLFTSIIGRYPVKIKTKDDKKIKIAFKEFLSGLQMILPCIFCRNSLNGFIKELPIEPYLVGRIELMYWMYLIKDKVNKKLIYQENQCYKDEKIKLKKMHRDKIFSENEYYDKIKEFKKITFITTPTPPFKEVLDKYEKTRAICSPKALSCVLPEKI
jgi:hypothetical protein